MLLNGDITIRCVEETDLEFLCFCASPAVYGSYQGFRFASQSAVFREYSETGFWTEDGGVLLVEAQNEAVGLVQVTFVREGLVRLGLMLLPDNRGEGIGTQVIGMMRDHLAENYAAARIEADTDTENIAAQRILENNGFVCEGTLRAFRYFKGSYHDSYIYSYITALGRRNA